MHVDVFIKISILKHIIQTVLITWCIASHVVWNVAYFILEIIWNMAINE